jgi:DNA-binding Lrp family transcriptional regulator
MLAAGRDLTGLTRPAEPVQSVKELGQSRLIASALEAGIPLVPRPFRNVAEDLGIDESIVLDETHRMVESGFIRRFGAFLDYRRLGKVGSLFGVRRPEGRFDEITSFVCDMKSVTHCYVRRHRLDLWFTAVMGGMLSVERLCGILRGMGLEFVSLVAARRIKLCPSFASDDTNGETSMAMPDETADGNPFVVSAEGALANLIGALQDGFRVEPRPFAELARQLGIEEADAIGGAARLMSLGVLRRIGASINHNRAGYVSNSLLALRLPDAARAGSVVAGIKWASHCYERSLADLNARDGWPYNIYVMIHARTDEELSARESALLAALGASEFTSMRTEAEYKKIPYRYGIN